MRTDAEQGSNGLSVPLAATWFVIVCGSLAACGGDLPSVPVTKGGRISYFARDALPACSDLGARLADVGRELSAALSSGGPVDDLADVTYYHFNDADDLRRNAPCTADGATRSCAVGNEVFSAALISQHELVHAFASRSGPAAPLLEEGLAEAIKCGPADLPSGEALPVTWREAAGASPHDSNLPYVVGRRIVQWTRETFGGAPFMRHYRDSVPTLSPALIDLQYRRQFGQPLDQVWDGTWIRDAVPHERHVAPTCPCVGDDLLADGFGVTETTCTPLFRSFQAERGQAVRLRSFPGTVRIADCAGHEPPITTNGASSERQDVLLRLSDVRHYIEVMPQSNLQGVQVEAGEWLTEDCAGVAPVLVDRSSARSMTWIVERTNRWRYLAFENATSATVVAVARDTLTGLSGTWQVCDSCASCVDVDVSAGVALVPGTTRLRVMSDPAPATAPPHVLYRILEWDFQV